MRTIARVAVVVALGLIVVGAAHARPVEPIYSVGQLDAGLRSGPRLWLGRTVFIRGVLDICPANWSCFQPDALTDHGSSTTRIPARLSPVDPIIDWFRHLPIVGRFAPRRPGTTYDEKGTYRVRIVDRAKAACAISYCTHAYSYYVLVLDGAT